MSITTFSTALLYGPEMEVENVMEYFSGSNRNQVAAFNCQEPRGCNYCNSLPDQRSS